MYFTVYTGCSQSRAESRAECVRFAPTGRKRGGKGKKKSALRAESVELSGRGAAATGTVLFSDLIMKL